jgi:hypothetical protein
MSRHRRAHALALIWSLGAAAAFNAARLGLNARAGPRSRAPWRAARRLGRREHVSGCSLPRRVVGRHSRSRRALCGAPESVPSRSAVRVAPRAARMDPFGATATPAVPELDLRPSARPAERRRVDARSSAHAGCARSRSPPRDAAIPAARRPAPPARRGGPAARRSARAQTGRLMTGNRSEVPAGVEVPAGYPCRNR